MEGKSNKSVIVILSLIILCLAGYIVYDELISTKVEPAKTESAESTVQSVESKEKTEVSMVGYYMNEQRAVYNDDEEVMFYLDLSLFDNNMYYFSTSLTSVPGASEGGQIGSSTYIGSYKVEGDKVYLYQLLEYGNVYNDGDVATKTIVLNIKDDKTIEINDDLIPAKSLTGNYTKDVTKTDTDLSGKQKAMYEQIQDTFDFYKSN